MGFYIRGVVKREGLFNIFYKCIYRRNGLVYYDKRMDFEAAKESIKLCKRIVDETKDLLNKGLAK